MLRIRPTAIVLALLLLTPGFVGLAMAANWQPDDGDWAGYRRSADHRATTGGKGAFTTLVNDLRIKWQRTDDPGYWVPPVAADLDRDGIAEIVASVGNASADPSNIQNPVSVEGGLNVINGATGALKWSKAPEAGYLDFYSPTLGDIDNDGQAEILWFHAQPLTGSSLTNRLIALEADGTQKWAWSDSNWGSRVPLPLTTVNVGNADGESAQQEVVFTLLLATVTTTIQGGKVNIAGSNPEYRLIALNGETGSPTKSWEKVFTGKATGSNVALGDLNADGILDPVHGVGAKSGTLIETDAAVITVSADFADDKIRAYTGGANPPLAFEFAATGFNPGELGNAPVVADLDADGQPEIVNVLWVRNYPPAATDTSTVLVLNKDGTEKWRTVIPAAASALIATPPPAVADLDGDGKLDIVIQTNNGDVNNRYRMIALRHDGTVMWRSPSVGREITGLPAIGDITGDGKPEVLGMTGTSLSSSTTQTLLVYNGQTGAELMRKTFDVGPSVGGPLLVDLDGDDDGRLEILVNTGFWGDAGKLIALEPELPDLRLTGLAFSSTEHLHGVTETVSATVANIGSRQATDAVVRFTENGATLHEATVTLAAGASQVVSFPWTPGNLGGRTIAAEADPGKAIPEFTENNQRETRDVTVRAPELRFATGDPVFSDGNPGQGETIQVTVTLTNGGGKDATNVLVWFQEDGTTFAEHTLNVAKGASAAITKALTISGQHDRTIAVIVDPLDTIVEENEGNNRASKLLDVVAPDLSVGAIAFSKDNPGVGETVTVTATVTNVGLTGATGVVVQFLDEGTAFDQRTFDFAEGQARTLSADLLVEGEFDHLIEVVADPGGTVTEEREDNNRASRLLDVIFTAPDFVLGDLQFSNPTPGEDETIQVSVTVTNAGNRDAAASVVRFLDDGAAFGDAAVPALAQGASAQVQRSLLVQGAHDHTIVAIADPDLAINEQDELNNQRSALLQVLVPDLSLAAADLSPSDPNPDDGDVLTVSAVVRNVGPGGKVPTDVLVRLLDGGAVVAEDVLASIPAGSSATASLAYAIAGVGARTLTVQVDPLGAINELSDLNNAADLAVVVGKLDVAVTMSRQAYPFQTTADGVVHVAFRNTGAPLAGFELPVVVEYVISSGGSGAPASGLASLTGALLAQLGGFSKQRLQLCSMGRCVELTTDIEGSMSQLLGGGGSGGSSGELTLRTATIPVTTDVNGNASFVVPLNGFTAFDSADGLVGAGLCLTGFDDVFDAIGDVPLPVPVQACNTQVGALPALPAVGNLPGSYRATAYVDWHGFGFHGSANYIHV